MIPSLFLVALLPAVQSAPRTPSFAKRHTPSFAKDVQPILAEHCLLCHGPDATSRKASLRLDTEEGLSFVIEPGQPEQSELLQRIRDSKEDRRMPPPDHGPRLSEAEVTTLTSWIEGGAAWESHWAYAPFEELQPPQGSAEHPIDRFVQAPLAQAEITPAALAGRRTLIRRLTLDLWGLNPSPEEIEAFLQDTRPGAYERLVDRLLASPHYAERFARHWMDLARYADSHGFTIDGGRSIWPWRDWVIEALAQDMPYDQFTIEQLAGDLLPNATAEQRIATGFHRNTQVNQEGGAKDEENRISAVLDRVSTTGAVWLGSTLSCAQCHDHKYDPVRQREFYQLFALFNQTTDGGVSSAPLLPLPDEAKERELSDWQAAMDQLLAKDRGAATSARAGADLELWQPTHRIASNGPNLRLLEDGSIQAVGHNATFTVYTLEGSAPAAGVRSLWLEALSGPGLPKGGPGRAGNGNFVLDRVEVAWRPIGEETWRELPLASARANFEQDTREGGGGHYPAAGVLSDEPGWAISPRVGEPHVLVVELEQELPAGQHELRVALHHEEVKRHPLARFRLYTSPRRIDGELVPAAWTEASRAVLAHAGKKPSAPTTMVLEARRVPRVTHLFERGNFLTPGDVVEPGVPAAFNHFGREPVRDRLELARWLVHDENSLAHRVTVNRHWQYFFGSGLVETENDFGLRGARPSHPELLDWLAQEFVRLDQSLKALHRLIVTSATYRQSSFERSELRELDPANRRLARQRPLRLEAEALRDSALRASGLWNPTVGGPPVQPPQPDGVFRFTQAQRQWKAEEGPNRYRRSLYTRIWRSAPYPFFMTFDAPNPSVTCTRRRPSQTPLQALTLANDPMILELARGLSKSLLDVQGDDAQRLQLGFERCLGRPAEDPELALLRGLLERRRAEGLGEEDAWTAVARVLFNTAEFSTRP